jgi:hypothetical protein
MAQIILEISDETLASIKEQVENHTGAIVHKPLELLKAMLEEDQGMDFESYIDHVLDEADCSDGFEAQYGGLGADVLKSEEEDEDNND